MGQDSQGSQVLYKEVQRFPKWTLIFVIAPALIFFGIAFVQLGLGKSVGSSSMSNNELVATTLIFGLLVPLTYIFMKASIIVTSDEIKLSLLPLYRKRIHFEDIKEVQLVGIKAIEQFGGWGIRANKQKKGFVVAGNEGIELILYRGKPIVIATQRGIDLFNIINNRLIK
ncbi:DUF6141 family protein [Paenibacillus agilis]|uniref:Bacterial Pleckstrin homology domain-containing protein n=1 Tax=Paenibacillus agilis TaxID=3020863 RepID=A0A559J040_9BACL|nr:DUF6141 family protein [Paenibacillus agilis]TVX93246.1 hypothetical protein FPZ44_09365 [Paenibacillus agilis]